VLLSLDNIQLNGTFYGYGSLAGIDFSAFKFLFPDAGMR
jgi:hypothetical protein